MRSLEEILERLLVQADGAVIAAVGGMDGLVVEQRPEPGPDLSVCVAEFANALTGVRRAVGEALAGGAVQELDVRGERVHALVRHVTPDHYVLLALQPSADLHAAGRALGEAATGVRELLA
jgi:predicted regulator of Ras-like GTPase activity (Roadblock/LC7/MglB family)